MVGLEHRRYQLLRGQGRTIREDSKGRSEAEAGGRSSSWSRFKGWWNKVEEHTVVG